jgi:hypothetical protein
VKIQKKGFELKPEYEDYDMPIKAFSVEYAKDFKAYLSNRFISINTVFIHLRSIQSILNDAEKTYTELKGHKPLETIKKANNFHAVRLIFQDNHLRLIFRNPKKPCRD